LRENPGLRVLVPKKAGIYPLLPTNVTFREGDLACGRSAGQVWPVANPTTVALLDTPAL
jgi:hypothetical protein